MLSLIYFPGTMLQRNGCVGVFPSRIYIWYKCEVRSFLIDTPIWVIIDSGLLKPKYLEGLHYMFAFGQHYFKINSPLNMTVCCETYRVLKEELCDFLLSSLGCLAVIVILQ